MTAPFPQRHTADFAPIPLKTFSLLQRQIRPIFKHGCSLLFIFLNSYIFQKYMFYSLKKN